MGNNELKSLCLNLIRADSESAVIGLLREAGYWENNNFWRYYGDKHNNAGIIGSQQQYSDAAIVEKLVNSIDAKLMAECLKRGIEPEGKDAPSDIRSAVALFFEDAVNPNDPLAGVISEWPNNKRKEVAKGINLCATGYMPKDGRPCFTISDDGEGQTPLKMPDTLLSLAEENKIKIPFVQGQFNQGGSGVLRFCGNSIQQLVVSKRIPYGLNQGQQRDPSDDNWGFTVVRREDPAEGWKSSVYSYLAPVGEGADRREGNVLNFSSESMPILNNGKDSFVRESKWGTLIKLYEYENANFSKSHILRADGLQARLDLLLPYIALPIRAHECRSGKKGFKGHDGSFDNNINGLSVRLHDDHDKNIEADWPVKMNIEGEIMNARIFVFRSGKQKAYKKNEGIIFSHNGQTQGTLTQNFFIKKKVKRNYLKTSLLVIVDCSAISLRSREKLFMNSRDRISGNDFAKKIEAELEDLLRNHPGLKELEEKRRREEAASKLEDDKPLENILEKIFKDSPTLANLFLKGIRASNPFKTDKVAKKETAFKGAQFPTYFKFRQLDPGKVLNKGCPSNNSKARIEFETDAENAYFERKNDPGTSELLMLSNEIASPTQNYTGPYLHNGIASLNVQLSDNMFVGSTLRYKLVVQDSNHVEPIVNEFVITVQDPVVKKPGGTGKRLPPSKDKGEDREHSSGITMPNIEQVSEAEWGKQNPVFDKFTSLRVIQTGEEDEYDFKINIDNIYLKSELKSGKSVEHQLVISRFIYGMVLIGLSLLQEDKSKHSRNSDDDDNNEEKERDVFHNIESNTRAIAPILLPMINSLADLQIVDNEDAIGEEA